MPTSAPSASGSASPKMNKRQTATTLRGVGRFAEQMEGGAVAGEVNVEIDKGIFCFANSTSTDALTTADIGSDCYIVDDQTVAKTNGSSTRSVAGRVFDVDSQGVWVDLR